MTKSRPIRIPTPDYNEIRAIQREYNIGQIAAYQIWKNKELNMGMKWKQI